MLVGSWDETTTVDEKIVERGWWGCSEFIRSWGEKTTKRPTGLISDPAREKRGTPYAIHPIHYAKR